MTSRNTYQEGSVTIRMMDLMIFQHNREIERFTSDIDPDVPGTFRPLLLDAIRRAGRRPQHVGEFRMEIRERGSSSLLLTYVTHGWGPDAPTW